MNLDTINKLRFDFGRANPWAGDCELFLLMHPEQRQKLMASVGANPTVSDSSLKQDNVMGMKIVTVNPYQYPVDYVKVVAG